MIPGVNIIGGKVSKASNIQAQTPVEVPTPEGVLGEGVP